MMKAFSVAVLLLLGVVSCSAGPSGWFQESHPKEGGYRLNFCAQGTWKREYCPENGECCQYVKCTQADWAVFPYICFEQELCDATCDPSECWEQLSCVIPPPPPVTTKAVTPCTTTKATTPCTTTKATTPCSTTKATTPCTTTQATTAFDHSPCSGWGFKESKCDKGYQKQFGHVGTLKRVSCPCPAGQNEKDCHEYVPCDADDKKRGICFITEDCSCGAGEGQCLEQVPC